MTRRLSSFLCLGASLIACMTLRQSGVSEAQTGATPKPEFRTSDRCVACHNGLKTSSGEDISIGFEWRASIMANSSRDPYWQGSVRRESLDHPESKSHIEDECSGCHMPIKHLMARAAGSEAEVFAHLPLSAQQKDDRSPGDGVTCSVCHQIEKKGLGTSETFNGNVVIANVRNGDKRPEYGPYVIDAGHQQVMQSSTGGYVPQAGDQVRDSALCGSCHTLYTKALGPAGQEVGVLPEQMPYLEWLHSEYPAAKRTCQSCHMPEVREAVAVTALYGQAREGVRRHQFLGANFLMERMLNDHRDELDVKALPEELSAAADRTAEFLKTQAARVTLSAMEKNSRGLAFAVSVQNLTGHKFPTAYPSRRAWLHVVVRDRDGRQVFESGALNLDGSIAGNDNDEDALRFEPHYTEITNAQQVEIYEPILGDVQGKVTTGLLTAVRYLKDNRILPSGFVKNSAGKDIAVVGDAASDPNFTDQGSRVRYVVDTGTASGPFVVEAELLYQPVGYRWAHNLEKYAATEPQRFVSYYQQAASHSATTIARAEASY